MRFLILALLTVGVGCSSKNNSSPKDMAGGGGAICPNHPENCGGTCCGDSCLVTDVDRNHCGSCDKVCNKGEVCTGGRCGCLPSGAPCATNQTCCLNAGCADLNTDIRNCGSCNHGCGGDGSATCEAGVCKCGGTTCSGTDVCCNGTCQASCNGGGSVDMATGPALPGCDCTGLDPMPIPGVYDQCPASQLCVAMNCCYENTQGVPFLFMCTATPTVCSPSSTPQ
jgi:hypothetical protein